MMNRILLLAILALVNDCHGLVLPLTTTSGGQSTARSSRQTASSSLPVPPAQSVRTSRRAFVMKSLVGTIITMSSTVVPAAMAGTIPMVSTEEFTTILRDSARSIQRVEFSGPKSETVIVKLVDGTAFGINDVIESSTDPRSPLKIASLCRENQIPTKFVSLEQVLASAPKKKKNFANQRVQDAAAKEKERLARIQQDEQDRLAQLYKMQEQEAEAATTTN